MHETDNASEERRRPRSSEVPSRRAVPYRRAIFVSIVFHVVLITGLLFWYTPGPQESTDQSGLAASGRTDAGDQANSQLRPPTLAVPVSPEIPPEQIVASVESQIEAVEALSDDRKLSELEKSLARLDAVATEESVEEVTAIIGRSLGLEAGPVPSTQPPDGLFDPETAQIQDVTRVQNPRGGWEYQSVLVDAQGRTQTVPMRGAEGETAYRTFEQMKKYPLAEGIYRQLVMPMIQKMIQASESSDEADLQPASEPKADD